MDAAVPTPAAQDRAEGDAARRERPPAVGESGGAPGGVQAGAALLFTALVLACGAFAWREAETQALAAAEAQGRGLLRAVTAGVEASLAATEGVEELLAERLTSDAQAIAARLAASPGLEDDVLRAEVLSRGLLGAAVLDPDLGVVASADASRPEGVAGAAEPFAAERLAKLDVAGVVARIRAEGATSANGGTAQDRVVVGFDESPFAARTEFAVALRVPSLPGYVLLRADASRRERFRQEAGIARVLRESAAAEGIAYLAVQGADGTCVAADDPALVGKRLPPPTETPAWQGSPRRTLDLALPVAWEKGPAGHLRVGLGAEPVEAVIDGTRRRVAFVTLGSLAIGLGGLFALAAAERRRRAAEARLAEEIARRERFTTMGRMAAGVAHEIRGPLNALSLSTQLLARASAGQGDPQVKEHAASVRTAVARVDAAVEEFLAIGRGEAHSERAPVDVADLVADALASEGGEVGLAAPPARVTVQADRRLLARALANLVRNARQAGPASAVSVAWRLEGADATIDVDDGGPGVPGDRRATVFEPFETTRPNGTGLGLTIARDAVERHGGRIEVLDAPSGGARFRIRVPVGVAS
jgi:signal transduction histidine kinase